MSATGLAYGCGAMSGRLCLRCVRPLSADDACRSLSARGPALAQRMASGALPVLVLLAALGCCSATRRSQDAGEAAGGMLPLASHGHREDAAAAPPWWGELPQVHLEFEASMVQKLVSSLAPSTASCPRRLPRLSLPAGRTDASVDRPDERLEINMKVEEDGSYDFTVSVCAQAHARRCRVDAGITAWMREKVDSTRGSDLNATAFCDALIRTAAAVRMGLPPPAQLGTMAASLLDLTPSAEAPATESTPLVTPAARHAPRDKEAQEAPVADEAAMAEVEGIDADACAVCLGDVEHAALLECGHRFCQPCIEDWLSRSDSCPICRQPVQRDFDMLVRSAASAMSRRARRLLEPPFSHLGITGLAFTVGSLVMMFVISSQNLVAALLASMSLVIGVMFLVLAMVMVCVAP